MYMNYVAENSCKYPSDGGFRFPFDGGLLPTNFVGIQLLVASNDIHTSGMCLLGWMGPQYIASVAG